jgi:hypothetical protein
MKAIKYTSLILLFALLSSFNSFHHGWANYNQKKVLDYTGIIEESTYENPHATAKVKTENKTWLVILAPTSRMDARGVSKEMLEKGKSLHVVGYPHKTIKDEMRAERIFINDKKYELR